MAARKQARTRGAATATREDEIETGTETEQAVVPGDVESLLSEIGEDGATVGVWRVHPTEGEQFILKVAAAEWDLAALQREWGGGKYKVRVRSNTPDGGGRRSWKRGHTFTIAGKSRSPDETGAPVGASAPVPPAAPVVSSAPWLGDVMKAAIPVMVAAFIAKMTEKQTTDPLILELIRQMGQAQKGESLSIRDVQDMIRQTREEERVHAKELAAARVSGGGDGDGGLAGVLRETLPPMVEMFGKALEQRRGATPAPAATATATVTAAPAALSPGQPEWVARVRPFVGHMVKWADAGKTPAVKAENVIDDLTERDRDTLAASCETETFLTDVFVYFPELGSTPARREWFVAFFVEVQGLLTETDDDEGTESATETPETPAAPGEGGING